MGARVVARRANGLLGVGEETIAQQLVCVAVAQSRERWDGHLVGTKVQRARFGKVEKRECVSNADLKRPY